MANPLVQLVDLSLPVMKEIGGKWIEETAEYLATNLQFVSMGIFTQAFHTLKTRQ